VKLRKGLHPNTARAGRSHAGMKTRRGPKLDLPTRRPAGVVPAKRRPVTRPDGG